MTHHNPLLAYTPTPEFWALLTLIAGGLVRAIYQIRKDKMELKLREQAREDIIAEREQTRLDLAAVAALTVEQLEALNGRITTINEKGENRLKVLLNSNVTTRAYAKKAIEAGNDVTGKLSNLTQALIETRALPQQVEVINPESNPVHVKES